METINIIRTSANCPEVILSMIIDREDATAIGKIAESKFIELAKSTGIEEEDFEAILDNGYFDEPDGDTISIHWAKISNPFKAQIGDMVDVTENSEGYYDFEGRVVRHRIGHDGKIITTVIDADDDAFDLYDEEFELVE